MRAILVNIFIFMAIIGAYYIDFFGWFTSRYAFFWSFGVSRDCVSDCTKSSGQPICRRR